MATCANCLVIMEDDAQRYSLMDMCTELRTFIHERILLQVDEDSLLCEVCFCGFLNNFETRPRQSVQYNLNVCVTCRASLLRRNSMVLSEGPERTELLRTIGNSEVPLNARVCNRCWYRATRNIQQQLQLDAARGIVSTPPPPLPAPQQPPPPLLVEECVSCNRSLRGRRTHSLFDGPERSFLVARLHPQVVPDNAYVCYACWLRTQRTLERERNILQANLPAAEPEVVPPQAQEESIHLDNVRRVSDSSRCFVPGCRNAERLSVPIYLKKRLLSDYKLYIPQNARVCQEHKAEYDWEFLEQYDFINRFSKIHIEDMLRISLKSTQLQLDFEHIENMNEDYCNFWIGVNSSKFMNILNQSNINYKSPRLALGTYLLKLRTGETIRRISSLLGVSKGLTCKLLKVARSSMLQNFVPRHLGHQHINRDELIQKNLLIPEGLFGDTENRKAIVICDGTYIYTQNSSNYSFQKKTYSLHKKVHLVKPFLMVATDGHILDVFGPYAATFTDADIMKSLFQNENHPLRSYFQPGDVFILDRGFRDSIPLLESLGYRVYKPETLIAGQTQLSTLAANKSRCVTLCRWVVEVVNGRYKRDYKIFRDKYFNVGSRHLMTDFKNASALINAFHPVVQNRPDAVQILNKAIQRLEKPNYLAHYVIENNINRRRANFRNINEFHEDLNIFPQMAMSDLIMFSLGIYQIKQARSYYGEHIRQHGSFVVEVSEIENEQLAIPDPTSGLLLRGRIRSRHITNKIYYTYLFLVGDEIKEYYCSCICGRRTVGCCAHTMTLVWYLGWARHQDNIEAPASFLDNILVSEETDEETEIE